MYMYEKGYMRERMNQISCLLYEFKNGNYRYLPDELKVKKFKFNDNPELQQVIDKIDSEAPFPSFYTIIYKILNGTVKLTEYGDDDIVLECYIIEKLIEFAILSYEYDFPNKSIVTDNIENLVINHGPYRLVETFQKEENKYDMINVFIGYKYHSNNLNGIRDFSDLDGINVRLESIYADRIYDRQIEKKKIILKKLLEEKLKTNNEWNNLEFVNSEKYRSLISDIDIHRKLRLITKRDEIDIEIENLMERLVENELLGTHITLKKNKRK